MPYHPTLTNRLWVIGTYLFNCILVVNYFNRLVSVRIEFIQKEGGVSFWDMPPARDLAHLQKTLSLKYMK